MRDPLWLLARQWQTGGFLADEAGTPVRVHVSHATASIRQAGSPVAALQRLVEAEPAPAIDDLDNAALVVLAVELGRRLREEGAAPAVAALAAAFPFDPPGASPRVRPFVGRVPDVRALYPTLVAALGPGGDAGALPAIQDLDPALVPAVERACRGWLAWLSGRVAPAAGDGDPAAPPAWDAERVEYRFRLSTHVPAGTVELVAPGRARPRATRSRCARPRSPTRACRGRGSGTRGRRGEPRRPARRRRPRARGPGHVRPQLRQRLVPGAAAGLARRHDDHRPDRDRYLRHDHGGAGRRGGRPWAGSLAALGPDLHRAGGGPARRDAAPAAADRAAAGGRRARGRAPRPRRDGEPRLARGAHHAGRRRGAGRPLPALPAAAPGRRPVVRPGRAGQAATYRLGTPLPDHWYPLVAATGPGGRALLALAEVPAGATGVEDTGVRGRIVPHAEGTVVADEEVPREGVHLRRRDRLALAEDGVALWRARTKIPGLGEASSGLRFDVLQ